MQGEKMKTEEFKITRWDAPTLIAVTMTGALAVTMVATVLWILVT